ncbi:DELTA-thalatoxin-Avl1a-like [Mastacembelus armatus]|uniref:DELTA-thalatoxin-Avl1a-like n=1 Tax=Mastacembelus armatus TaxID=205130 RepID=UPI000E459755|nr:DELTA-thalatoxin-Avl1a-like [Mastacembelus armatus]
MYKKTDAAGPDPRAERTVRTDLHLITATGDVMAGIPTDRWCTFEIKDDCSDYKLCNPRTYTYSGHCETEFPPVIGPSQSGSALFVKTPNTACGAVGVLTFDLYDESKHQSAGKMAIMFSNPYDFVQYSNMYAIGVFGMDVNCDYDLYYKMYNGAEDGFVRGEAKCGGLTYESSVAIVRATMSNSYQPVIQVVVCNN